MNRRATRFEHDPPATEFQRGWLSALKVARAELGTLAARRDRTS